MTNWLERARREIPKALSQPTAITDERSLTAVLAVPDQPTSDNSLASIGSNGSSPDRDLSEYEETAIRNWLARIGEDDPKIITEILRNCRHHSEARAFFLEQSLRWWNRIAGRALCVAESVVIFGALITQTLVIAPWANLKQ